MAAPTLAHALLLAMSIIALATATRATAVTYTAEDLTSITLYGAAAEYRPQSCPTSVTFSARARPLPSLRPGRVGILPSDISLGTDACRADVDALVFTPLGRPPHLPPQWLFEAADYQRMPVNFTCGDTSFQIRFGYFNDVQTDAGFLDPAVAYFDFAVVPNTQPFSFCSYATRGGRPLDHPPFPTLASWEHVQNLRRERRRERLIRDGQTPDVDVSPSPDVDVSPSPEA